MNAIAEYYSKSSPPLVFQSKVDSIGAKQISNTTPEDISLRKLNHTYFTLILSLHNAKIWKC